MTTPTNSHKAWTDKGGHVSAVGAAGGTPLCLLRRRLTGPWLTNESWITIHTNQLREEFQDGHDLTRKDAILEQIQGCQNFHLRWRNCNVPGPRLDHARELKITFADQSCCLVTFEKGLDFVRRRWDTDEYEVTERTKVFVELM